MTTTIQSLKNDYVIGFVFTGAHANVHCVVIFLNFFHEKCCENVKKKVMYIMLRSIYETKQLLKCAEHKSEAGWNVYDLFTFSKSVN